MPTDTARGRTDAVKFALRGVAWSLGFFGLLRLSWTEAHVAAAVHPAAGRCWRRDCSARRRLPVEVTLACSGADALALCLGADPRLPGAVATAPGRRCRRRRADPRPQHAADRHARTGGRVAGVVQRAPRLCLARRCSRSPSPDTCSRGCASRIVGRRTGDGRATDLGVDCDHRSQPASGARNRRGDSSCSRLSFCFCFRPRRRSISTARASSRWPGFIARAAAAILGVVGVSAHAAANVLWTPRGGFLVTQECISTPLIPVYLAAVCAYSTTWRAARSGRARHAAALHRPRHRAAPRRRAARVVVASPLFLVHAFYQLLLGAVVVFLAALWRHGGSAALRHALAGVVVGVLFVRLARPALHAHRHVSHRRAARRSAGSDRAPPRVPDRPLSRAVGRGIRRGGLEALPRRARGARAHADGRLARAARPRQPVRPDRARARRPRLGGCGPGADLRRGGQRCPARSLRSPRSRRWPRSSPWSIAAPVLRAPSERVFGMEIVGRHHDPFTVMAQFARPIGFGVYSQPRHRHHRRVAGAPLGSGGRVQLAGPSQLSAVRRCGVPAGASPGALAGGARPSRRWPTRSPRSTWPRPPIILTSRRRSGCRCTCSRCGAVSTTPRRSRLAFSAPRRWP